MPLHPCEKDIGAGIVIYGMLLWLSIEVGPWWVGLLIFAVGYAVNLAFHRLFRYLERLKAYGRKR